MQDNDVTNRERPRLRESDISRVIVIDFEGIPHERPVLLGILRPGGEVVDQVVLDPDLRDAARRLRLNISSLEDAVTELVDEAEERGHLLVGWSLHEPAVAHRWCDATLAARFDQVYRDAKREARVWYQQAFPGAHPLGRGREGATLQRFTRLTGFHVPVRWGGGKTAARIRQIRRGLHRAGGRYRAASKPTKRNWHDLLKHNELDCLATLHVLHTALGDDPG
jgi:hypothetical protein